MTAIWSDTSELGWERLHVAHGTRQPSLEPAGYVICALGWCWYLTLTVIAVPWLGLISGLEQKSSGWNLDAIALM